MRLTAALEKKFNDQITLEFESNMVYRQLAVEADAQDLPGMASWLRHQADEEIAHANKFIEHLDKRDNHAVIGAMPAPKVKKEASPLEIFQLALKHEQKVSESIRDLYRACDEAGDLDSRPLLTWFISEQIEEEDTVNQILGRIQLIDNDGPGLLRLDAELGSRPASTTENPGPEGIGN